MGEATASRRWHESSRLAVGLISGTSLDGVDAALIEIGGSYDTPRLKLLAFSTAPYSESLRRRLLQAASGIGLSTGELTDLHARVAEAFARAAVMVCKRGKVTPRELTAIGSHGQTVFHQGRGPGKARAMTLQIGEAAIIAEATGVPVVSDFRWADIAAGGEGAPLVPMVDYLLLRHDRQGTIALNLGGIANVTIIPAGARPDHVFGFDTGPGNMVMDSLVRRLTRGTKSFDRGGRIAAQGRVINSILRAALADPFFARRPSKSAGREQFGEAFINNFFADRQNHRFEDLVRTACELTAVSVAQALNRFVFRSVSTGQPSARARGFRRLVISGGGAHNKVLQDRIGTLLPSLTLHRSDDFGLPVDAKEAMAFAILADRTMHGLAGNLPSVTGARRPVVLGKVSRP